MRYFVSYHYMLGRSEKYETWSVERDAPICTDDDVDDIRGELTEKLERLRRGLNVSDLQALYWRRFEDPE